MSDTLRIERPLFCRRTDDRGGRVKLDSTGNLIMVKTRISDTQELPDTSSLSITLEPRAGAGDLHAR